MKRLAVVLSILAALSVAPVAVASGTLSGTYRTKIGAKVLGGQLTGTWTISFHKGAYTVTRSGTAVVHGKYAISNSTISFGHETGQLSCKPPGTYTFKLTGKKVRRLRFTRVMDAASCAGRAAVLAGHFTKVR